MKPFICIYHAHCLDGFGSAWVVKKFFEEKSINCEMHAGIYNDAPPDVAGKKVFLVDFSYKTDVLLSMLETANRITIIDHHLSAIEDLASIEHPKLELCLDKAHSGCMLTWSYFYSKVVAPPPLILTIEDRDMWRFALPNTKEINAALFSHDFDFDLWDKFMEPSSLPMLITEGAALLRAHNKLVAAALRETPRRILLGDYNVPIVNADYNLASDIGNILSRDEPFSISYHDTAEHRVFSLRSCKEGANVDVSKIAEKFNGGGHHNAAGFRLTYEQLDELLPYTVKENK